ncbi:HEXXH motif domain-containing protein [Streptomyces sp. NPDC004135]
MTGTGISRHRLSLSTLDAIARGAAGPDVVHEVRRAERSRTLLLLRAVRDEAASSSKLRGPLVSLEPAWQVLDHVQQRAPAALETVLSYPYVAAWAGVTLRRLRRGHPTDPTPAWVHLGHLRGIAAAAALHAGIDVDLRVPARSGTVTLPTLGAAFSAAGHADQWSVARIRSRGTDRRVDIGDDTVRMPSDLAGDAPGWWALQRLECREGSRMLTLRLDDLDPYRGLYETLDPHRLDDAEVTRWRHMLADAWHLVCRHLPDKADAISAGLDAVVPRPFTSRFPLISASSGEAFAGINVARPQAPEDLAEILVHEYQHVLLGGLLHLVPLTGQDEERLFYAPWRDDPRPAAGLLQGVYAFFGVTDFWRAAARSGDDAIAGFAAFNCARWLKPTLEAARALLGARALTTAGRRFLDGIVEQLATWAAVTPRHCGAQLVTADHQAGWRLRYLRPDPAVVAASAHAWREADEHGVPDPGAESLVPESDGRWSPARLDLLRCVARGDSSPVNPLLAEPTGATVADIALADGRYADALEAYRAEVAADPDHPPSWIGFALAWSCLESGPGPALLLRQPHLVRAVHRLLRAESEAPQPDALATWLADRLPTGDDAYERPRTGMA